MRPSLHSWRLAATAALMVLAGCFKLSREAPPVQYFVLSGATTGTATVAPAMPDTSRIALGLRRIILASYLNVPAIIVRRGANELVRSDFHRWGEDPGEGINRVMAAHLATAGPIHTVDVAPWAAGRRHDYLVQLEVSRFEGVADPGATEGRSHVVAGWDIIRPSDGRVLVRGNTDASKGRWRVTDYAGLVAGLDAALERIARDIGACLARFPNDSTPPARCESSRVAPPQ